jgi:hypothetical protein
VGYDLLRAGRMGSIARPPLGPGLGPLAGSVGRASGLERADAVAAALAAEWAAAKAEEDEGAAVEALRQLQALPLSEGEKEALSRLLLELRGLSRRHTGSAEPLDGSGGVPALTWAQVRELMELQQLQQLGAAGRSALPREGSAGAASNGRAGEPRSAGSAPGEVLLLLMAGAVLVFNVLIWLYVVAVANLVTVDRWLRDSGAGGAPGEREL